MSTMAGALLITAVVVAGVAWNLTGQRSAEGPLSADGRVDQVRAEAIVKDETLFEAPPTPSAPERVNYTEQEIEYLNTNPVRPKGDALILIGQIQPPVVNGKTLQASSIHIDPKLSQDKRRVFIGYNMRGEEFIGAVQILEINKGYYNLTNFNFDLGKLLDRQWAPKVLQTVVFRNFDINAITEQDGVLYLGGGTGDESFKTPAALEVIKLQDGLIPPGFSSARVDVPSFSVTSIAITEQHLYVATGDRAGGIVELPRSLPNTNRPVHYQTLPYRLFEVDDVRDLTFDKDYVYAVKGTDAGLWVLDRKDTSGVGKLINLQGATIPESKSTIELTKDSILLALGDGGVQLLDRTNFSVRHQFNQKQHYKNDNSLSVSNAASGQGGNLFIADGEEGTRVMTYDKKNNTFSQTARISFGDGKSVNDIKYLNGLLIMASGVGGVKIAHYYQSNAEAILEEARDSEAKGNGK